jgi:hypothetical protein
VSTCGSYPIADGNATGEAGALLNPLFFTTRVTFSPRRHRNSAGAGTLVQSPFSFQPNVPTTRDPKAAAEELERTVRKLGFVGALINGHVPVFR